MNDTAALRREVDLLKTKVMALENDQRELRRWLGAVEMTIEAIKKIKACVKE